MSFTLDPTIFVFYLVSCLDNFINIFWFILFNIFWFILFILSYFHLTQGLHSSPFPLCPSISPTKVWWYNSIRDVGTTSNMDSHKLNDESYYYWCSQSTMWSFITIQHHTPKIKKPFDHLLNINYDFIFIFFLLWG